MTDALPKTSLGYLLDIPDLGDVPAERMAEIVAVGLSEANPTRRELAIIEILRKDQRRRCRQTMAALEDRGRIARAACHHPPSQRAGSACGACGANLG